MSDYIGKHCPLCKRACDQQLCKCTPACVKGRNVKALQFMAILAIISEIMIGFAAWERWGLIWLLIPFGLIVAWCARKMYLFDMHIANTKTDW